LARPDSPFNFYDPVRPIYTHPRFLPGSVVEGAQLRNVLMAEGCQIHQAELEYFVIGVRSHIAPGVRMRRTIMMGSDYYDPPDQPAPEGIPLGIGADSQIEGAIIDKNARLGAGVVIRPFPTSVRIDRNLWVVQDGVVVVPKSAVISPGTIISPDL
jgi:glucose-1-phosphate adenylyltransferase